MKGLTVSCKKCDITMEIVAKDPLLCFGYLTNGNTICKRCNNELTFESRNGVEE